MPHPAFGNLVSGSAGLAILVASSMCCIWLSGCATCDRPSGSAPAGDVHLLDGRAAQADETTPAVTTDAGADGGADGGADAEAGPEATAMAVPFGCVAANDDGWVLCGGLYDGSREWMFVDLRTQDPAARAFEGLLDPPNIRLRPAKGAGTCLDVRWGRLSVDLETPPARLDEAAVVTLAADASGVYASPDGECSVRIVDADDYHKVAEHRCGAGRWRRLRAETSIGRSDPRVDWVSPERAFIVSETISRFTYFHIVNTQRRQPRRAPAPPSLPTISWGRKGAIPPPFRCEGDSLAPRKVGSCLGCEQCRAYEVDIDDDGDLDVLAAWEEFPCGNAEMIAGRQVNAPHPYVWIYRNGTAGWTAEGMAAAASMRGVVDGLGVSSRAPAGALRDVCVRLRDAGYMDASRRRYVICFRQSTDLDHEGLRVWRDGYQFEGRLCREDGLWVSAPR